MSEEFWTMKYMTVLGEGAWGTAFATVLAHNGYKVKLWCHDRQVLQSIASHRVNERYLPGISLSSLIEPTISLEEALHSSEFVFEAIPVPHVRALFTRAKKTIDPSQILVILSKGIEQESLFFPSQIIDDVLGYTAQKVVISGPSYAYDLARQYYTGVALSGSSHDSAVRVQTVVSNCYVRPYLSADLLGVQAGGALKNVLAVAVGLLDGAGYGDNVKAFLVTRGFAELIVLAQVLGAAKETLYGLSGMGDLMLTAFGKQSRNVAIGRALGSGQKIDLITTPVLPEGIKTIVSVKQLLLKHGLQLPIFDGIYQMVFENKPIKQFLNELMQLPLECE